MSSVRRIHSLNSYGLPPQSWSDDYDCSLELNYFVFICFIIVIVILQSSIKIFFTREKVRSKISNVIFVTRINYYCSHVRMRLVIFIISSWQCYIMFCSTPSTYFNRMLHSHIIVHSLFYAEYITPKSPTKVIAFPQSFSE